ncbi:MAG: RNA polymerase sigma factor [Caloramator sp.]|nr:MAG: RNA polymerase sigma factor [Caloramator sp.]
MKEGLEDVKVNSLEDFRELILKSQAGDKEAEEKLIKNNIGLVTSIVKRFLNRGYEYEDLFQIGCIGLIKAIKKFDVSYDVKFSTYAVPMILGEIKRFMRDDGIIKVSRSVKETARKVKLAKDKLAKEYGREATIEEIANELSITAEEVILSMDSMNSPEYLYDTVHQDDGAAVLLIDRVSEDKDYGEDIVDKVALKELIQNLEPRDRQVIFLRYFKDLTQSQIAEILGISQVQVSRIEKRVLTYLKKAME